MTSLEATVIVRDGEGCRFVKQMDEWDATTLLAAASADPRSFHELQLAWRRYRQQEPLEELRWQDYRPQSEERPDGPWILVDLANLLLETNCAEMVPEELGAYVREEGEWTEDNPAIWINYPPGWRRVVSSRGGPELAPQASATAPARFRDVLFGPAMAEAFAARMQQLAVEGALPAEHYLSNERGPASQHDESQRAIANRWHELTVRVHADWLMTPRDDLAGEPPRVFLHRGRDWVDREVDHRFQEWSKFNIRPLPLDQSTQAFLHGPMGTEEVVVYFDLCREVIRAGWKMLCESPELRDEVPRWAAAMEDHGRNWLERGQVDGCSVSPSAILQQARQHMPQLDQGEHLDCDCPICRAMEDDDGFGPVFRFADGHHLELDDEFACSLYATREEWEEHQWASESPNGELRSRHAERDSDSDSCESTETEGVWSGTNELSVSVLSLSFRLAEIISDLSGYQDSTDCRDKLNRAFDEVRRSGATISERQATAATLKDKLEDVAVTFPSLTSKSADLQSQLDQWVRQLPPEEKFTT